jgi:hypothetical protein
MREEVRGGEKAGLYRLMPVFKDQWVGMGDSESRIERANQRKI